MWNAIPIQLNEQSVVLKELTIDELMQVAKIPIETNELQINSLLGFALQDSTLPAKLTVNERYCLLLHYLALSHAEIDVSGYFLPTETPVLESQYEQLHVSPLYGYQATFLQRKCENAYDWLIGQMAMQCWGDLTAWFSETTVWEKITGEHDLEHLFERRIDALMALPESKFEQLHQHYFACNEQLQHLVHLGYDNEGLALINTDDEVRHLSRFHAFTAKVGIIAHLASFLATTVPNDDDIWEDELE